MSEKLKARIAQLELELTTAINDYRALDRERSETIASVNNSMHRALEREKETRAQFADLKERVANLGAENHRLQGYLDRVREDDHVREDLIPVGDPSGEQRLVPKRKHAVFLRASDYSAFGAGNCETASGYISRDRPKPRHWVNY